MGFGSMLTYGEGLKDPDHYKKFRKYFHLKINFFAYLFYRLKVIYRYLVRDCPKVLQLNFDPRGLKKALKGDPGLKDPDHYKKFQNFFLP